MRPDARIAPDGMRHPWDRPLGVWNIARSFPDHPAILSTPTGRASTFGELVGSAHQLVHALRARGVGVDAGDVVIAISASGNSPNVLNAVTAARELGATTIGFSGYYGGKLATLVDIPVVVQNHSIEQIEDVHMILEHMVTASVRQLVQQAVKHAR